MILLLAMVAQAAASAEARRGPAPVNAVVWITSDSYPREAIERSEWGVVGSTISVDARGRPTRCRVTVSSGSRSLDQQTCKLLMTRGRFEPATDGRGRAVAGEYSPQVRWTLPGKGEALLPVPEGLTPATPNSLGLSQETFDALKLAPGTVGRPLGPPTSDGRTLYAKPIYIVPSVEAPAPLRAGAVLARATTRIVEQAWRTAAPVTLQEPFTITLPAGSPFGATIDRGGRTYPCLVRPLNQPFTPLVDRAGDIYPGLCLIDRDGDGRYERVRLLPYLQDRKVREVEIAPAALVAVTPRDDEAEYHQGMTITREVFVESLDGEQAIVALRETVLRASGKSPPPDILEKVSLPLRDGASVPIASVRIGARNVGGQWVAEPSSALAPWVALQAEGLSIGERFLRFPDR